jgi:hypothetical protein
MTSWLSRRIRDLRERRFSSGISQRARVLRLRRTDCSLASIAKQPCCLPPSGESRRPNFAFFEAQSPCPPIRLSTLQATSRDVSCKIEGQDGVAVSVLVGLFHSLQHDCRFIPAHPDLSRYRTSNKAAMAKIPKTPKDTTPYDPPAYTTFSDDDVASISKFIQTGLLQMLR